MFIALRNIVPGLKFKREFPGNTTGEIIKRIDYHKEKGWLIRWQVGDVKTENEWPESELKNEANHLVEIERPHTRKDDLKKVDESPIKIEILEK